MGTETGAGAAELSRLVLLDGLSRARQRKHTDDSAGAARPSETFSIETWRRAGSGDRLTLAQMASLPREAEDEILTGSDQRLVAVWASRPRREDLLDRAAQVAREGFVIKTLILQEELPRSAVGTLLRRCILDKRLSLVADLLDLADPVSLRIERQSGYEILSKRYADFRGRFANWTQLSLESCLDVAEVATGDGLGALESCARSRYRDHPRVRKAVIDGVRQGKDADQVSADWVVSALSLSAYLSEDELELLQQVVSTKHLTLPGVLERRLESGLPNALADVGCAQGRVPEGVCLKSLKALEGEAPTLTWVSGTIPLEVVLHAHQLSEAVVRAVVERTTAELIDETLRELVHMHTQSRHPVGFPVSLLIENLGTQRLQKLPEGLAREVAVHLSKRGWSPLTWAESVDARVHDVIAESFTPVGALLGDKVYAQHLEARLASLSADAQEAARSLLPEWVGSWAELSRSASSV